MLGTPLQFIIYYRYQQIYRIVEYENVMVWSFSTSKTLKMPNDTQRNVVITQDDHIYLLILNPLLNLELTLSSLFLTQPGVYNRRPG